MKRIRVFIFSLFILVLLVGCGSTKTNVTKEKKISIEDKVKQKMEKMTLEQKIAQMLVVYYTNDTVDDSLKENVLEIINTLEEGHKNIIFKISLSIIPVLLI